MDDHLELRRETLVPLRGLVRSPSVPELVRYLQGTLPDVLAYGVEVGLTTHPQARSSLLEVRDCIRALESLSIEELERVAGTEGLCAEVSLELLADALESVSLQESGYRLWAKRGWKRVREEIAEGGHEAQTAWSAFLDFAGLWKAELLTPRVARARGTGSLPQIPVMDLPVDASGGTWIVVEEALLDTQGDLKVSGTVCDIHKKAMNALEGVELSLALQHGEVFWTLVSSPVDSSQIQWHVRRIGALLGLPSCDFPTQYLRIFVKQDDP